MKCLPGTLLIATAMAFNLAFGDDSEQLFNGNDLSGWKHVGFGRFVVENGLLHPEGGIGLLWLEGRKVGNAVVRVVYKVESNTDNSGVFVRIPEVPADPWDPVNNALEIQINDSAESGYYSTGSVYTLSEARARPGRVGEWNTMDITLDGPRTAVHINGILVTEYAEGDAVPPKKHDDDPDRGPRPETGYIALQNHPVGKTVYFKEVSILPIEE